jgi:hypothetical protein
MSRGPGIWQRRILAELDKDEMFPLVGRFTRLLARRLTQAEVSALHRAAKCLESREQCRTALVRVDDYRLLTFISRPDSIVLKKISVERVPSPGTASTLIRGSLRQIAAEEGVSKTQVVRDLQSAKSG